MMTVKKVDVFIADIADQYLRKFASVSGADRTFRLRDDGKFYIGNKEGKTMESNIIVGDRAYVGKSKLWELIEEKTRDDKMFANGITIIMLK